MSISESVQISCATDVELIKMSRKVSYTAYWRKLIREEMERRLVNEHLRRIRMVRLAPLLVH